MAVSCEVSEGKAKLELSPAGCQEGVHWNGPAHLQLTFKPNTYCSLTLTLKPEPRVARMRVKAGRRARRRVWARGPRRGRWRRWSWRGHPWCWAAWRRSRTAAGTSASSASSSPSSPSRPSTYPRATSRWNWTGSPLTLSRSSAQASLWTLRLSLFTAFTLDGRFKRPYCSCQALKIVPGHFFQSYVYFRLRFIPISPF